MKKETEGKLTLKSAKRVEGKQGDLVLKGSDKPLRGVTIVAVKRTIILRVKTAAGDSFPVELTDLEEFKEYGTRWHAAATDEKVDNSSELKE